jgi:hypothetical protein
VINKDGTPKWRMAPSPHGAYWKEGMKLGYQDQGCWTLLKYAAPERAKAGWLYAQFCVSKTVTLKKSVSTLHLIRESDIWHDAMSQLAPKVGGLVEFYRSPARKLWTPTGVNVPEYGKLAQVWWQNVSKAISGEATSQRAMDSLAAAQDAIMARVQKSGVQATQSGEGSRVLVREGGEGRQPRSAAQARQREATGVSQSTTTNCSRHGRRRPRGRPDRQKQGERTSASARLYGVRVRFV